MFETFVQFFKEKNQDKERWSIEKLRLYINYAKTLEPILTYNANKVIQRFFLILYLICINKN